MQPTLRLVAAALALFAGRLAAQDPAGQPAAQPAGQKPADDGWLDISSFLAEKYGFLPIAMPITEPAVGYGAAGGVIFLSKPLGESKAGFGRPDISMLAGMGTENDTWAAAAGDIRHWLDDRLQTRAFLLDSSLNLDFHGVGDDDVLDQNPLRYELDVAGTMLEARYRLGDSTWWVGLQYHFARVDVSFRAPSGTPGLPEFSDQSEIGGLTPSLTFDSRNNMFTPTSGTYVETTLGLYDELFGGDDAFQRFGLIAMQYVPLAERLWLALRGDVSASFGEVPFYLRPYVTLRGVPMLRYQGEEAASLEIELRWQFWERISLVGFGGVGAAWNDTEHYVDSSNAIAGGIGLRYELAREYGIHAGFDVAFGPEETVLYIQIGSAWARP